jgi:putative protein kinase ArgK-like GTPase of G3E family
LQWQKAGLLEVADIVVVHKADLPGAERLQAQVQGLLNLPGCRLVPVLSVSSGKETGLEELWAAIDAVAPPATWPHDNGQRLLHLAQQRIAEQYEREPARLQPLMDRWRRGELDDDQAAEELLRLLALQKS